MSCHLMVCCFQKSAPFVASPDQQSFIAVADCWESLASHCTAIATLGLNVHSVLVTRNDLRKRLSAMTAGLFTTPTLVKPRLTVRRSKTTFHNEPSEIILQNHLSKVG